MKKIIMNISLISAAIYMMPLAANDCPEIPCRNPKTFLAHRSQSVNAARYLCGMQEHINKFCKPHLQDWVHSFDDSLPLGEQTYGAFSTAFEYTQTFRDKLMTDYFFGKAATNGAITFSGSKYITRGANDVLADYFGLPQDFKSVVAFKPRVQNFLVDFDFYLGLESWGRDAYFRIHAPLVYTRWGMNPCETISSPGVLPYPLGYMTVLEVPRQNLPKGVLDTFAGNVTFGDMKEPLAYGKISRCPRTKIRLSDVQLELGWNFINKPKAHMGFNLRMALPAGNKPTGEYLFEPIVGNGGHFELGLGFSSHVQLWESECNNQSLSLYCDVNATHLFATKQVRQFDFLENGELSRYILSAEYKELVRQNDQQPEVGHVAADSALEEYAGNLFHSINRTTLCADVNIQLQADAVIKLTYNYKTLEFDLGYNFWGRTKERVDLTDRVSIETYGLKGDVFLYGATLPYNELNPPPMPNENTGHQTYPPVAGPYDNPTLARQAYNANVPNSRIPLSAMQEDDATIFGGGNYARNADGTLKYTGTNPELNIDIDSPRSATAILQEDKALADVDVDSNLAFVYSPIAGVGTNTTPIRTSNPVDFFDDVDPFDLDLESAATPSTVTHKIFVNVSNTWRAECRVQPFVSGGFEIEFDAKRKDLGKTACDCRSALNQWGVFVKGGVGF